MYLRDNFPVIFFLLFGICAFVKCVTGLLSLYCTALFLCVSQLLCFWQSVICNTIPTSKHTTVYVNITLNILGNGECLCLVCMQKLPQVIVKLFRIISTPRFQKRHHHCLQLWLKKLVICFAGITSSVQPCLCFRDLAGVWFIFPPRCEWNKQTNSHNRLQEQ